MPTYRGKRFTDASLLGLAQIETIRRIALYDTVVTDDGLVSFALKARKLTSFHMSSTLLTDRGLGAILANCPIDSLQTHDAAGVTDACAAAISEHGDITELYLNDTSITDRTPERICGMPNIWSFCADGSRITDSGLEPLGKMPQRSLLSLNRTRVNGRGMHSLAALEGLHLYLEDCRIGDASIADSLPRMTNLKLLSLSRTDVTDAAFESVTECRQLEDIRLSDTGVSDRTLDLLADLPQMQTLYIERTAVTADGVARLKAQIKDLCIYSDFLDAE